MQEAYHPLHSKCLLCWGVPHPRSGGILCLIWGKGVPHPRSGGVLCLRFGGRGYPIPGLGGTLSKVWGVPHPRSGEYPIWSPGYPIPGQGGTPSQVWGGTLSEIWGKGVPHPRSGGYPVQGLGGTPSQVWGVPHLESWVPHPRSRGYPIPGLGVPHLDLVGGYPIPGLGGTLGTPSHPDLGWGTPPARPEMGYPPRPGTGYPCKCGQTHRLVSKHYPPHTMYVGGKNTFYGHFEDF